MHSPISIQDLPKATHFPLSHYIHRMYAWGTKHAQSGEKQVSLPARKFLVKTQTHTHKNNNNTPTLRHLVLFHKWNTTKKKIYAICSVSEALLRGTLLRWSWAKLGCPFMQPVITTLAFCCCVPFPVRVSTARLEHSCCTKRKRLLLKLLLRKTSLFFLFF